MNYYNTSASQCLKYDFMVQIIISLVGMQLFNIWTCAWDGSHRLETHIPIWNLRNDLNSKSIDKIWILSQS